MVYLKDSHSHLNSNNATNSHGTSLWYYTPPSSTTRSFRSVGRSMRTIRSNFFQSEKAPLVSENLTNSVIDLRLGELTNKSHIHSIPSSSSDAIDNFLEISQTFSDYSACSSDISGELQLLASLPSSVDWDLNQGSKYLTHQQYLTHNLTNTTHINNTGRSIKSVRSRTATSSLTKCCSAANHTLAGEKTNLQRALYTCHSLTNI